jgi:hypothetical protein
VYKFLLLPLLLIHCQSWGKFWDVSENPVYTWYSYWGSAGNESPVSTKPTADGGYVVLSSASAAITSMGGKSPIVAFSGSSHDWLVIKVTAQGNLSWYTFIGSSADDFPGEIAATNDGGVIVAGFGGAALWGGIPAPNVGTFSGAGAMFIVKLNADGTLDWYDTISGTGDTQARGVIQTTDGGYIVAGLTTSSLPLCTTATGSYQSPGYDSVAIKLNSSGGLQWCTYVGAATTNEYGVAIRQAADGGYFIACTADGASGTPIIAYQGAQDILISKLTSSGIISWQTFLGTSGIDSISKMQVTQDTGLVVAGSFGASIATLGSFTYTGSYGGGTDGMLAKLNSSGQLQWFKLYGGSGNDAANDVFESPDGNLTVAMTSATNITSLYGVMPRRSYNAGDDMILMRSDSMGNPVWYEYYGSSASDQGNSVAYANDGGFIFAGTAAGSVTNMLGSGPVNAYSSGNDAFLLKLKADGSL